MQFSEGVSGTTIVVASNYFNHHQRYLSEALDEMTGHSFFFIETMEMEQERKNMGWGTTDIPVYVLQEYDPVQRKKCRKLIQEADVVIWGSCPYGLILPRLLAHKLTFCYSERIFKEGLSGFGYWGRAIKYGLLYRPPQKNHYLLASSAYAPADHARLNLFRGKTLRWGYFPQTITYSLPQLMAEKNPTSILWAARMIPWKHPEYAIDVAKQLRQWGCAFTMELVGNGELQQEMERLVAREGLQAQVKLTGACTPEQVRRKMERAAIFLVTSDQNEGWGAVVNEAMNSGCAVVACRGVGAAPFLIESGKNGLLFEVGDLAGLAAQTRFLLEHPRQRQQMGEEAYRTIADTWNSSCAARRLIALSQDLLDGKKPVLPQSGPCSPAPIIDG